MVEVFSASLEAMMRASTLKAAKVSAIAMIAVSCHGGGGPEPPEIEAEATTQALSSSDIDRILGFESTTTSDWAIIQSGRGTLSCSTSQSLGHIPMSF